LAEQRSNRHTVSSLMMHLFWHRKYLYGILQRDIKLKCRALLIQNCDTEDVEKIKGLASIDHAHMHINYRPASSLNHLVKKLKGRSFRKLQQEFLN
jgi:putative transposase